MTQDPREEGALLRRVGSGDETAFRTLFRAHNDALYRFGLRLTGGRESDTEEALQEAWVRAVSRLSSFGGRSAFRTWVSGILVRCVQEQRRRASRDAGGPDGSTLAHPEAHLEAGPDHALRIDVEEALRLMPEGYRSVVVMAAEGFTHEEIAGALDISVGTSKSQLARGRRWLRNALDR